MARKAKEEHVPTNEITHKISMKIEDEPYLAMMTFAKQFSPNECSGTGLVRRIDYTDGSVEFVVEKVFLPLQSNTPATTDIEDSEMGRIHTQLIMDGDDPELHKFHWHSHVDMAVFHSVTDTENYDEMKVGDYGLSLVVNKKFDMLASYHLYNPLRINILDIAIEPPDLWNVDERQVPEWLAQKLELDVARVREHEAKLREEARLQRLNSNVYTGANWQGHFPNHKTNTNRRTAVDEYDAYMDERDDYGYGGALVGLDYDPDFIKILQRGERKGIIRLLKGANDVIVGYQNIKKNEYYTLCSEYDLDMNTEENVSRK